MPGGDWGGRWAALLREGPRVVVSGGEGLYVRWLGEEGLGSSAAGAGHPSTTPPRVGSGGGRRLRRRLSGARPRSWPV